MALHTYTTRTPEELEELLRLMWDKEQGLFMCFEVKLPGLTRFLVVIARH